MAEPVVANHHAHHEPFAGVSGTLLGLVMALGHRDLTRFLAERTGVGPTDRVVDVGCGSGSAVRLARRRGAEAVGVDPSDAMLRVARWLTRDGAVEWRRGSAEALPLDDGWATIAWSLASVHHWSDVERGIAECHRVLAPGGQLLVVERHTSPGATGLASHGWHDAQTETFAEQCRAAGFVDVSASHERVGRRDLAVVSARHA